MIEAQIVRPTKAPNLPIAPTAYETSFMDDLMRTLRLYYNTIDSVIQQLVYGFKVDGAYYSTVTQPVATANGITLATYNGMTNEVGIRLDAVNTSRIIVERTGVFEVQVSAQVAKTSGTNSTLFMWLRVNGINVNNTGSEIVATSANVRTVATRVYRVVLTAEDYVEVAFSSTNTNMRFVAVAPAGNVPQIPSITTTVTFIAPL